MTMTLQSRNTTFCIVCIYCCIYMSTDYSHGGRGLCRRRNTEQTEGFRGWEVLDVDLNSYSLNHGPTLCRDKKKEKKKEPIDTNTRPWKNQSNGQHCAKDNDTSQQTNTHTYTLTNTQWTSIQPRKHHRCQHSAEQNPRQTNTRSI